MARILLYYQTCNLVVGETTCERFSRANYKQLHLMLKEVVLMESQMGLTSKKKMQTLIIDDMTSTNDTCLSNTAGMCLNTQVLSQKELI